MKSWSFDEKVLIESLYKVICLINQLIMSIKLVSFNYFLSALFDYPDVFEAIFGISCDPYNSFTGFSVIKCSLWIFYWNYNTKSFAGVGFSFSNQLHHSLYPGC